MQSFDAGCATHKSPKAFRVIDTARFLGQSSLAILRDESCSNWKFRVG